MLCVERLEDRITPSLTIPTLNNIMNVGGIETIFLRDNEVNVVITDGRSHVLERFSLTDGGKLQGYTVLNPRDPLIATPGFHTLKTLGDTQSSSFPSLLQVTGSSQVDSQVSATVVQLNLGRPVFTDDPDVFAEVFINDGVTPHGDCPWTQILAVTWPLQASSEEFGNFTHYYTEMDSAIETDLDSIFALALDSEHMQYVVYKQVQDWGYTATWHPQDNEIVVGLDDGLEVTLICQNAALKLTMDGNTVKDISLLSAISFAELNAALLDVQSMFVAFAEVEE